MEQSQQKKINELELKRNLVIKELKRLVALKEKTDYEIDALILAENALYHKIKSYYVK